jgi:hypothetical protein
MIRLLIEMANGCRGRGMRFEVVGDAQKESSRKGSACFISFPQCLEELPLMSCVRPGSHTFPSHYFIRFTFTVHRSHQICHSFSSLLFIRYFGIFLTISSFYVSRLIGFDYRHWCEKSASLPPLICVGIRIRTMLPN